MIAVLSGLWRALPEAGPWRPSLPGPSHAYSPLEPEWSQIVFPMLGASTTGVLSMSSAGAQIGRLAPMRRTAWLALFSGACYALAVLLFAWLIWELGIHPLSVGGAAAAFALAPAMWASALTWRPDVALLPLLLAGAVLTARAVRGGSARVWLAGVPLALAVSESLAAVPLVVVWPVVVRAWAAREGVRGPKATWAVAALALVSGAALQLLSGAIAYRLGVGDGVSSVSWDAAFRAVTSGWRRLFLAYLPESPAADALALARASIRGAGPLCVVLAIAGLARVRDSWGRGHWFWLALTLLAFGSSASLGPTVSDTQPLALALVAAAWLYAAAGLEWFRVRGAAHLAVVTVVVALGVLGRVAQFEKTGAVRGRGLDEALDSVLVEIPAPAAIVADRAGIDRRVVEAMSRSVLAGGWIRLPQQSSSIRQALSRGRRVFAFEASVTRLEASGWALGSPRSWVVTVPVRHAVRLWPVESQAPCVIVGGSGPVDISTLAAFGSLGVQFTAAAPAELDLRYWASDHVTVAAQDVISGQSMPVRVVGRDGQRTSTTQPTGAESGAASAGGNHRSGVSLRLPLERSRGQLLVVRFSRPPDQAAVGLRDGRPGDTMRVCAATSEGEFVDVARAQVLHDLSVGSPRLFGEGWHGPELLPGTDRFVRWASSTSPTLRLLFEATREAIRLEVEASPAAANRGPTIGLSANGNALATHHMSSGRATYAWVIAPAHLRPGLNVLEFSGPPLVTPREVSGLPDDRGLGFSVNAVRVGALRGTR